MHLGSAFWLIIPIRCLNLACDLGQLCVIFVGGCCSCRPLKLELLDEPRPLEVTIEEDGIIGITWAQTKEKVREGRGLARNCVCQVVPYREPRHSVVCMITIVIVIHLDN